MQRFPPRLRVLPYLLLIGLSGCQSVEAEEATPPGRPTYPFWPLEVTYRMKEDGKVGSGFHFMHLSCLEENCFLTTLSLNQCGPGMSSLTGGKSDTGFYPKVERTSTEEGNLRVKPIGKNILLVEQEIDTATLKFRIEYGGPYQVTSFSGAMVKTSVALNKVITVEFVPLVGRLVPTSLDCPILLPGIVTDP